MLAKSTFRAVMAAGTAPDSTMTARPSADVAAIAAQISRALCTAAASADAVAAFESVAAGPLGAGADLGLRTTLLMPPLRNTCAGLTALGFHAAWHSS